MSKKTHSGSGANSDAPSQGINSDVPPSEVPLTRHQSSGGDVAQQTTPNEFLAHTPQKQHSTRSVMKVANTPMATSALRTLSSANKSDLGAAPNL
jgi:hypothetical protein